MFELPPTLHRAAAAGFAASALFASVLTLGGCESTRVQRTGEPVPGQIVVDGDQSEWPRGTSVTADENFVYFRLGVQDERTTIQQSDWPVSIWLDADANAATGRRVARPSSIAPLGVDVEIAFSPLQPADGRAPGRGAVVRLYGEDGVEAALLPAQADVVYAPTHAAERFEVRVSRHLSPEGPAMAAAAKLAAGGPARAMYVLTDPAGETAGWSDPETVRFPPASVAPALADVDLPAKEPGTVRVVSYNVLRASPMSKPAPFGRLMQALDADIVLLQEWDAKNAATYEAWFTAVVPSAEPWRAVAGPGGVGVVARHPVRLLSAAMTEPAAGDRPTRFVPAVVRTPQGEIVVTSVHLKCCGFAGSPEDERRIAEAGEINAGLRAALGSEGPAARVIAGDFNLVGSWDPVDRIGANLAAAGGDLTHLRPLVLGDASGYTWFDEGSEFPPGRLDHALVGGAEVVRTFILDTARLSDRSLASIGLDRPDSAASDHRPIVIDLRLK